MVLYLSSKNNNRTKQSHLSYLAKPEKCQGYKFEAFNIDWVSQKKETNFMAWPSKDFIPSTMHIKNLKKLFKGSGIGLT